MTTATDIQNIIEKYNEGHRYFLNLDFDKGEKLIRQTLVNTIFENCCFSIDFSQTDLTNSRFINCNLKCCNFSSCDLTNTIFENCSLEGVEFKGAKIELTSLNNCYYFGQLVMFDKMNGQLESYKAPLVQELYENIPEFDKIADHSDDELILSFLEI